MNCLHSSLEFTVPLVQCCGCVMKRWILSFSFSDSPYSDAFVKSVWIQPLLTPWSSIVDGMLLCSGPMNNNSNNTSAVTLLKSYVVRTSQKKWINQLIQSIKCKHERSTWPRKADTKTQRIQNRKTKIHNWPRTANAKCRRQFDSKHQSQMIQDSNTMWRLSWSPKQTATQILIWNANAKTQFICNNSHSNTHTLIQNSKHSGSVWPRTENPHKDSVWFSTANTNTLSQNNKYQHRVSVWSVTANTKIQFYPEQQTKTQRLFELEQQTQTQMHSLKFDSEWQTQTSL